MVNTAHAYFWMNDNAPVNNNENGKFYLARVYYRIRSGFNNAEILISKRS